MVERQYEELYSKLRMHPNDTGSSSFQVVALSEEIEKLTEHLKVNKKDFSSHRSLLKKVASRKTHLQYLKRKDAAQYELVRSTLGLKR